MQNFSLGNKRSDKLKKLMNETVSKQEGISPNFVNTDKVRLYNIFNRNLNSYKYNSIVLVTPVTQ